VRRRGDEQLIRASRLKLGADQITLLLAARRANHRRARREAAQNGAHTLFVIGENNGARSATRQARRAAPLQAGRAELTAPAVKQHLALPERALSLRDQQQSHRFACVGARRAQAQITTHNSQTISTLRPSLSLLPLALPLPFIHHALSITHFRSCHSAHSAQLLSSQLSPSTYRLFGL
jgi:hypothetical protein